MLFNPFNSNGDHPVTLTGRYRSVKISIFHGLAKLTRQPVMSMLHGDHIVMLVYCKQSKRRA